MFAGALPDFSQLEDEIWQNRIARDCFRRVERFNFQAGAIDVNATRRRIDQPTKPRAVFYVLGHLRLQTRQAIRLASQLDHEIGAERREPFAFILRQSLIAITSDPGSIRRQLRAVRKSKARRGIEALARAVLFCPFISRKLSLALRRPVSLLAAPITMSSPLAVISRRRVGLSRQSSRNLSSVKSSECALSTNAESASKIFSATLITNTS